MIWFFVLMFVLGACAGGAAVAMVAAGDRHDQAHSHRRELDALGRVCGGRQ